MARQKSSLSKALIMVLARIIHAYSGKNLQDIDVREACETAGVAAVGQTELTGWLKDARETIPGNPADVLATVAKTLPESVTLALLAIGQTYNTARFETVYKEETDAQVKLQQALSEKDRCESVAREEVAALRNEIDHLNSSADSLRLENKSFVDQIRALEIENAVLTGRLAERGAQEGASETKVVVAADAATAYAPDDSAESAEPEQAPSSCPAEPIVIDMPLSTAVDNDAQPSEAITEEECETSATPLPTKRTAHPSPKAKVLKKSRKGGDVLQKSVRKGK